MCASGCRFDVTGPLHQSRRCKKAQARRILVGVAWDAAYKPFRPFGEWQVPPGGTGWRLFEQLLGFPGVASKDPCEALDLVARDCAIEGASSLIACGEGAPGQRDRLIASIVAGYSCAFDLAVGRAPVTESWIRQLHGIVCDGQSVAASDAGGFVAMPKGEYRTGQNHVWIPRKRRRFFSPALDIPREMQRFVAELKSEAFADAHPALQSAFALYAFVAVHPFEDGNGRVARALASIYTLRSHAVPVVVYRRSRGEYVAALRRADAGEYAPLVDFMVRRCRDAARRRVASAMCSSG